MKRILALTLGSIAFAGLVCSSLFFTPATLAQSDPEVVMGPPHLATATVLPSAMEVGVIAETAETADAPRHAELIDGVLFDLATDRVLVAGDALPDNEFLVIADARVLVAGRAIDLSSDEIVDNLSALGGAAAMMSGPSHVCALEDGVTWATADGGCKDLLTGLVWSTEGMGYPYSATAAEAVQLVAESTEGTFTDWRLPNLEEMDAVALHGAAEHFSGFVCSSGANFRYWSSQQQGSKWRWAANVCQPGSAKRYLLPGSYAHFVGVRGPVVSCNNDGVCDPGENCETCSDCPGQQGGKPSGRYCCGNGIVEGPEAENPSLCDWNP